MKRAAVRTGVSPEEYLAFERSSEQRHELVDGDIFAMAPGTMEHSLVISNVIVELGHAVAGRAYGVLAPTMRIKIAARNHYVYPDVSVIGERPAVEDEHRDTLLNPLVVVEVLSELSEAYDRGDKFRQYRTIPSLREYVLLSHTEPRIEVFTRQPDGGWLLRSYGPGERAALASLACELDVDRAYLNVFTLR